MNIPTLELGQLLGFVFFALIPIFMLGAVFQKGKISVWMSILMMVLVVASSYFIALNFFILNPTIKSSKNKFQGTAIIAGDLKHVGHTFNPTGISSNSNGRVFLFDTNGLVYDITGVNIFDYAKSGIVNGTNRFTIIRGVKGQQLSLVHDIRTSQ